ncbi:hypothetical protein ACFOYZ_30070, partial [Neobacillus cucumis]|uniref:hypothetical protein n=1 Tax=Neobacillus cucumis TaxID=1740721 RepID=UPI00361FC083
ELIFSKLVGVVATQTTKIVELKARYSASKDKVKKIDWECGCILSHGMNVKKSFKGKKIRSGYGSKCAKWESMPGSPYHEDCEKDGHDFCGCSWCYVHSDCGTSRKSKVYSGTYWSECHDKDVSDEKKIEMVEDSKKSELETIEEVDEELEEDSIPDERKANSAPF